MGRSKLLLTAARNAGAAAVCKDTRYILQVEDSSEIDSVKYHSFVI